MTLEHAAQRLGNQLRMNLNMVRPLLTQPEQTDC